MTQGPPIAFVDLQAQRERIADRIEKAIRTVLDHGMFIMGPEVVELEGQLANRCGVAHAVACASGTDALVLALMAAGIGRGDGVIVPTFTFAATAEAVAIVGATPVFVDVDPRTFDLDPASAEAALDGLTGTGLTPRALIAVDLFGQPADYAIIEPLCEAHGLLLVADAAQSYGATYRGRCVGAIGDVVTTSFFPAKPLGCYGDGGAVFTDDDQQAELLRSLRVHGQGATKYDNVRVGINGRLDTLQAAVLLEKLTIFDDELDTRQGVADGYAARLADVVTVPAMREGATSTWAQYTVLIDHRDRVARHLAAVGIPSAVYYPVPLHRQPAYAGCPTAPGGLRVADELARRVLSLPMHPYLDGAAQERVAEGLRDALKVTPQSGNR